MQFDILLCMSNCGFLLTVQASSTADNGGLNGVGARTHGAAEMGNEPAPASSKHCELLIVSQVLISYIFCQHGSGFHIFSDSMDPDFIYFLRNSTKWRNCNILILFILCKCSWIRASWSGFGGSCWLVWKWRWSNSGHEGTLGGKREEEANHAPGVTTGYVLLHVFEKKTVG